MPKTIFAAYVLMVCSAVLTTAQPVTYDVASVKENGGGVFAGGSYQPLPDGLRIVNLPLRTIIAHAYDFGPTRNRLFDEESFRLMGGPERLLTTHFNITAKTAVAVSHEQQSVM